MALHSGPKNGSGGNLDRNAKPLTNPPTQKRVELLREFDRLGAKEIRNRIDQKRYDRDTSECAQQWLSQRDLLHFDDSIRALGELMQLARNMARDSNLQAHDATSVAQRSNSFARAANEAAEGATEKPALAQR